MNEWEWNGMNDGEERMNEPNTTTTTTSPFKKKKKTPIA